MPPSNETFSRVLIDNQLTAQGWSLADGFSVRYEVVLEDGTRADYMLCDRHGRSIAVIEAKRFLISPGDAAEQATNYGRQLNVPYIFLANGSEIQFWEWQREAYPRSVKTIFKQDDLERRFATLQVARTEYVQSWLGFLQPTLEANAPQAAQKNINLEILRNLSRSFATTRVTRHFRSALQCSFQHPITTIHRYRDGTNHLRCATGAGLSRNW